MLEQKQIEEAKEVDILKVLEHFKWDLDSYGKMICPSFGHDDTHPSCSYNRGNNTVRCFTCGTTFDTIGLYQSLSEKTGQGTITFPWAVREVLALDGNTLSTATTSVGAVRPIKKGVNQSPYEMIINNSRAITGYELEYLHKRGIFLYNSYVYDGKVHTVQNLDKALNTEIDPIKLLELKKIKELGKYYKGIAPVLKANRIQIKHNYWQNVNSIIYLIDYDYEEDELLQQNGIFLSSTSRHMAIQKSLGGEHDKKALGTSDFIWIADGMGETTNGDIYICEGLEDAFSYTMHGYKSISLNSLSNINSLMNYLENEYKPSRYQTFILSLDHDKWGQEGTEKLVQFFEDYNSRHTNRQYKYKTCDYPLAFHDINDYWVSRVHG